MLLFVLGVSLGTIAFLSLAALLTGHALQDGVIDAHGVFVDSPKAELSQQELAHLNDLIRGGHVLTGQNLVSELSRYYSGVMNTVLLAFSALAIVAFFSVRGLSIDRAEDTAYQAARRQVEVYFESQQFRDLSAKIIREGTQDLTDSMRQTLESFEAEKEEWSDQLHDLSARLEEIADRLAIVEHEIGSARPVDIEGSDQASSDHLTDPSDETS